MRMSVLILVLALGACGLRAAEEQKITVTATGTAKVLATDLSVSVAMSEKGEDAASALANIKALREKVIAKLAEFGARVDTERGELPAIVEPDANARRNQYRAVGRLKKAADASKPAKVEITMQQPLVAHIPLKAKDGAALLVEAETLKAKLRPDVTKLVKVEAEAAESEEEEDPRQQYNAAPVNFWFSTPRSESLQEKATADAVAKARAGAQRAAKAMGGATIELHNVIVYSGGATGGREWDEDYGQWRRSSRGGGDDSGTELYSATPNLSLSTTIGAEFRLK